MILLYEIISAMATVHCFVTKKGWSRCKILAASWRYPFHWRRRWRRSLHIAIPHARRWFLAPHQHVWPIQWEGHFSNIQTSFSCSLQSLVTNQPLQLRYTRSKKVSGRVFTLTERVANIQQNCQRERGHVGVNKRTNRPMTLKRVGMKRKWSRLVSGRWRFPSS